VALLWGLLAGLAFWTHLLAVVYLLPAVAFLVLARRRDWSIVQVGLAAAGALLGMLPLIAENIADGYLTLAALLQPPDLPVDVVAQFVRFFRVGVPVLLGLGQPTTSQAMFDQDWLQRPAGHLWVVGLALLVMAGALAVHLPALRRLVRCGADRASEPALLLFVVLVVPPLVALTRFGFFVSEPRYALPLYAGVPLLAAALWRIGSKPATAVALGVLGFNVWSLLSTDVRLWRPQDALDSTAATRAELVSYVTRDDRHQLYTDYWIGYPIMFETRETVLAYVISGGFNRYLPPADNVQRTPNPAWVFTPGSESEQLFLERLRELGGQSQSADVGAYRVYTDVEPLAAMRPPL